MTVLQTTSPENDRTKVLPMVDYIFSVGRLGLESRLGLGFEEECNIDIVILHQHATVL